MSEYIVKIEKLSNGYEVEIRDQKVVKANTKSGMDTPYKDPWCSYAFTTAAEVCKFLSANLDKAKPDEYSSSFDLAASEDADGDD